MRSLPDDPALARKPYVAGQFYAGDPPALRADLEDRLGRARREKKPVRGIVVPHAGYIYSGDVAAAVYAAADLPRRLIILGPNHSGLGRPLALVNRGHWMTPLGAAAIDEALADLILDISNIIEADPNAHRAEHSIEVQIPFLQQSLGDFRFVPVSVGTGRFGDLATLGATLATAIDTLGEPVGIVISTDMTHYEPAAVARAKDFKAIARIETLDAAGLHATVKREEISMCGYAPATAGLHALSRLGSPAAELVMYANSGDVSGDQLEVVGYAGMLIP